MQLDITSTLNSMRAQCKELITNERFVSICNAVVLFGDYNKDKNCYIYSANDITLTVRPTNTRNPSFFVPHLNSLLIKIWDSNKAFCIFDSDISYAYLSLPEKFEKHLNSILDNLTSRITEPKVLTPEEAKALRLLNTARRNFSLLDTTQQNFNLLRKI